ncbi:hypothetical protein [Aurantimonas coralicida]|nr:hypothetical protein [Aurantimonas coralicida]
MALTLALLRSEAAFSIDIGEGGMDGLDRLGEIVRESGRPPLNSRETWDF